MKATGINHLSIGAKDLETSVRFYEKVFGLERLPTYNFGFNTQYLRCGDLQIHIFQIEDIIPTYQHFALDVDDFMAVYRKLKELDALEVNTFKNAIHELPDGAVQMYARDPSGNLLEIDWPDVKSLDVSQIPELRNLGEVAVQTGDALLASLYHDRPHLRSQDRS